jgi:hypothetical protein
MSTTGQYARTDDGFSQSIIGRFDDGEVRMSKARLTERIKKNRDGHRAEYDEAMKGYRAALIEWFNEQRDLAVAGKEFAAAWEEPKPKDHTADYDAVLDMLDLSLDDEIILSSNQFRNYVRDEWGWMAETKASFSTYSGK